MRSLSGASLSHCGRYRYELWRHWDPVNRSFAGFIMLNPSTANAHEDDATIRQCRALAEHWGFGGIHVVNLYAFRATDPDDLVATFRNGTDVVGQFNDESIETMLRDDDLGVLVCAWGANVDKVADIRERVVCSMINNMSRIGATVLGLTKRGHPRHPLRLSQQTQPTAWANMEEYRTRA